MTKKLTTIACPHGIEGCLGLASHILGGAELEQTRTGYIARIGAEEFFGNCTSYQGCFGKYVKDSGPSRLSTIVGPINPSKELYIPESLTKDPEVDREINRIIEESKRRSQ